MSIIPWLNYPGRPIKKKFVKMPYSPPYKSSPYEYINLPNPGNLPQAVWENIMKDFDQTLTIRYKTPTSATLESAVDEFQEQPGAVGAGITIDPRKYLDKGAGVVFKNTFRDWVQSVVSWSDLDTIVEQRYIWRPLARGGKSTGGLKPLLIETFPRSGVYEGFDKAAHIAAFRGDPKFNLANYNTDIENLATNIETWVANGKSKGSRAFPWSQVQRYWLSSMGQLSVIGVGGTINPITHARAAAFVDDVNSAIEINNWVGGSSSPKGFRSSRENPFYTSLKGAGNWSATEAVLAANGFNPKNDRVLFDYQVREGLAENIDKKKYNAAKMDHYIKNDQAGLVALMQSDPRTRKAVAKMFGDTVTEADIMALTPAGLNDLLEKGTLEKTRKFYESKMILPGGQLHTLETKYIFKPGMSLDARKAARAKHSEVQKKLDGYNKEYERKLYELHRRIATDTALQGELRGLVGGDKFDTLMQWQNTLNFRENVFKTQDFLDSAFDDNSLFRTYMWLGRISRDLPDWMGNWGARLKYLTPQFYISGLVTSLDENIFGLASLSKVEKGLMRIPNGAWVALKGKASYQRAKDYAAAFKVLKSLDNMVNEGVAVNGVLITARVKKDLLLNGGASGIYLNDLKESARPVLSSATAAKHLIKDGDYTEYLNFLSGKFAELEAKGLVAPGEVEWLLSRVKDKTIGDKYLYMGPLVGLGRFLDHAQNLFVDKTIGKLGIFKRYADWFKAGNPAFAKAWQASKVGTALRSLSNKFIDIGGGKITTGFLARVFGSRTLAPVAKALGSLLGAVGGIVAGALAWLGTKLISDLWNLLRGKPVEATKEAVTKIGKFILGGCACCLSPLLLLVFIIFFFIAGVFSVVRQAGQAVTVGTIFDRLEVTKNGAYDPATNSIKYVVVVTNKDSKPQLIQFVRDNTTVYVGDCAQAPVTVDTTTGGPYGYLDFSGMSPGVQEHVDLASGDTITYNYSIKDIPASPGNITYMNKALIEILPRTGVGVSDTGTVIKTVDFGSGGCKGAGDLAAIASALKNCLRIQRNMTTYLILDTSCVSNTPILQTPNCVQAVNTYYIGSTTYNQNLQCVAFANIAVGCYGGADYYVAGNGSDWFDGASAVVYDKYRVGSALSAPPAGSLLTFSSSAGGHIAPVIRSNASGGRTTVVITGSNMRRPEYTLLFDEHGTLINPEALPGLTFMGFLVPK